MENLSTETFMQFVTGNEYVVVLFDAPWDAAGGASIRPRLEQAAGHYAGQVQFGEVDVQEQVELARSVGVLNVPAVGYYRGGNLVGIFIGATQDVNANTSALLAGSEICSNKP